jgi:outer membrane lipoprotein SlyB
MNLKIQESNFMNKSVSLLTCASALVCAVTLSACISPQDSNKTYGRSALSSATRTSEAQIVSKRAVKVDPNSGVGANAGGALGAIAGSGAGSNSRDGLAGAVIGAVAGATVGAAIESSAAKIDAFEYIVKTDVAGLLTIVQTDDEFSVGQRVFVVLGAKPVLVKAP